MSTLAAMIPPKHVVLFFGDDSAKNFFRTNFPTLFEKYEVVMRHSGSEPSIIDGGFVYEGWREIDFNYRSLM